MKLELAILAVAHQMLPFYMLGQTSARRCVTQYINQMMFSSSLRFSVAPHELASFHGTRDPLWTLSSPASPCHLLPYHIPSKSRPGVGGWFPDVWDCLLPRCLITGPPGVCVFHTGPLPQHLMQPSFAIPVGQMDERVEK